MISGSELLLGVLAPMAIASAIMLVAWRTWNTRIPRGWWGGATGIALAYIAAHIGLNGPPQFRPAPVESWLVWIALGGMIIGLVESRAGGPWWARLMWRALFAAGCVWLIARLRVINGQWSAAEGALYAAGLAGAVVVFWSICGALSDRIDKQGGGAGAALTLFVVTGVSAAIVVLDGQTLIVGQLTGALAMALLACAAVAWWNPVATIGRGGAAVVGLLAPMLWLDACLWSELHWWNAAALAISPALPFAADAPFVARRAGWVRTLVRVGAVAIPLAALLGVEISQAVDDVAGRQELSHARTATAHGEAVARLQSE